MVFSILMLMLPEYIREINKQSFKVSWDWQNVSLHFCQTGILQGLVLIQPWSSPWRLVELLYFFTSKASFLAVFCWPSYTCKSGIPPWYFLPYGIDLKWSKCSWDTLRVIIKSHRAQFLLGMVWRILDVKILLSYRARY